MTSRRLNAGFTLVELLVAVAITAVLAAVMLTVTTAALALWRRVQDNVTTDATALLILDYLERDMQGAWFRPDGNTWLACGGFDSAVAAHGWILDTLRKPTDIRYVPSGPSPRLGDARFGRSGLWLRLITTTGGTPVAVGYQIVRRSPSSAGAPDPADVRYSLFRVTVTAEDTFNTGYDVLRHDAALMTPSATYAVGTNVVDFGVWFYRRETDGALARIYPATPSDPAYAASTPAAFPACVEVMIRVLTDEGAATLSAMERGLVTSPGGDSGRVDEWWWSFVEAHSRVYTRRIELPGGAG